jgi:hypothetical protein
MKKYNFWRKTSNYSVGLAMILFILLSYFKKEVKPVILPVLILSRFAISSFLTSEVMKIIIKRKLHDK